MGGGGGVGGGGGGSTHNYVRRCDMAIRQQSDILPLTPPVWLLRANMGEGGDCTYNQTVTLRGDIYEHYNRWMCI